MPELRVPWPLWQELGTMMLHENRLVKVDRLGLGIINLYPFSSIIETQMTLQPQKCGQTHCNAYAKIHRGEISCK